MVQPVVFGTLVDEGRGHLVFRELRCSDRRRMWSFEMHDGKFILNKGSKLFAKGTVKATYYKGQREYKLFTKNARYDLIRYADRTPTGDDVILWVYPRC